MASIVIANLGTGNLHSVRKAVEYVSAVSVSVSAAPPTIAQAAHLILPGQGAMGAWVNQLEQNADLRQAIWARLADGPVLGICVGMQALFERSDENGGVDGLGILPGVVRHFACAHQQIQAADTRLKIPHMGWNQVAQKTEHPLWHGIEDQARFYFVHSYFASAANSADVVGECAYGNTFTAAVARNNIFATQFHPEKSQQAGLRLIQNFINWNGVN